MSAGESRRPRHGLVAGALWLALGAGGAVRADDATPPPPAPSKGSEAKPAPPAAAPTTRDRTIAVVAAVGSAARDNAGAGAKALTGDALADLYVRTAAAASGDDVKAFLVGLAHALDGSGSLGRVPVAKDAVRGLETPEAERARREVMGKPTLRGRDDWLLHWSVSAALAVTLGERAAGLAGLAKEASDLQGPSGFSFADLLADQAGIAFARWLGEKTGGDRLHAVGKRFEGGRFLPDAGDLEDGLLATEFAKRYGNLADERFLARLKAVRDLVAKAVPGWE